MSDKIFKFIFIIFMASILALAYYILEPSIDVVQTRYNTKQAEKIMSDVLETETSVAVSEMPLEAMLTGMPTAIPETEKTTETPAETPVETPAVTPQDATVSDVPVESQAVSGTVDQGNDGFFTEIWDNLVNSISNNLLVFIILVTFIGIYIYISVRDRQIKSKIKKDGNAGKAEAEYYGTVFDTDFKEKVIIILLAMVMTFVRVDFFGIINTGRSADEVALTDSKPEAKTKDDDENTVEVEIDLGQLADADQVTYTVSPHMQQIIDYFKNDDIVGYLQINDTSIHYPVLQYTDNEYYLSRDILERPNVTGWIYLDYENDIKRDDRNSIIYGHNMRENVMFHDLRYYADKSFYDQHKYVIFNTLYEEQVWDVFSFAIIDSGEFNYLDVYPPMESVYGMFKAELDKGIQNMPEGSNFDFNYFLKTFVDKNLKNDDQKFSDFLVELKSRSLYDTGVNVTEDDRILILSTCTNSPSNPDERFILCAKLRRK